MSADKKGAVAAALVAVLGVGGALLNAKTGNGVGQDKDDAGRPVKSKHVKSASLAPAGSRCWRMNLFLEDTAADEAGLEKRQQYTSTTVCGTDLESAKAELPKGYTAVMDSEVEVTFNSGTSPTIETISDDSEDADFHCACSTGINCEYRYRPMEQSETWVAAPIGISLSANEWRGSGCRRRPCVVILGHDQWPADCPRN